MRIPDSIVPDGSWASVQLVQVTLIALLGFLAWMAARRGRPALRGAILLGALAGVLLMPAVAAVVPVWLPLPEWASSAPAEPPSDSISQPRVSAPAAPLDVTLLVTPPSASALPQEADTAKKAGESPMAPLKAEVVVLDPAPVPEEVTPPPAPVPAVQQSLPLAGILAAVWGLGAAAFLCYALLRLVLLYRCAAQARPVRDKEWTDCLESLAKHHDLKPVDLRQSAKISSPLTLGLCRPVILLPAAWRRWSAGQRVLILKHELAHILRRDFLAGLVAELVVCLCWLHPLVRWLARRLRLEQEYAADAWVASATADPKDYVRCLARLALELDRGRGSLAPGLWRRRPEIMRRIEMLRRNTKERPARLGRRTVWTVALLTAAACLAAGGVGRLHSAADAPKASGAAAEGQEPRSADLHGDPLPAGALARLGTTRMRHGAEVTFVAFGPEGKTLLTAGRDNTICLWDLATGKEVRRFAPPRPVPPRPLADEEKGKKKKAEVRIERQMMLGGGNGRGSVRVALSPDGKTLAVSHGSTIQLHDVATGQSLLQIQASADGFNTLLFSRDGSNVLAGGFNGLLFSPDGRKLAARSDNDTLFVWATRSGKELCKIKPPPAKRSDGIDVFIVSGGGGGDAPGMAFTPDGMMLAAAATDTQKQTVSHSVKLWDLATGKEVRRIKAPENVGVVAVAPAGEVAAYSTGNTVHVCAVKTGKEVRQLQAGGRIVALAFTPDGKTLAVRARNHRVGLWDVQTGKEVRQLSAGLAVQRAGGFVLLVSGFSSPETRSLAISPDGKRVAAAAGSSVRLWETATGKEVVPADGHWKAPDAIVVAPDGKTVLSWGGDRVVRRWDAATGKILSIFPAPSGTTRAALSRDGRIVALANIDNTIRLHVAATGKQLHRLEGNPAGIVALAFAPDGKVLASRGGGDGIRLYDVAAGRLLRQFSLRPVREQGQSAVFIFGGLDDDFQASGPGLAFSPDGKLLATPGPANGRSGNTLVLIDTATGKELRKMPLPQPITSVAFSPNGRTLATENADRTVTLWEAASGKMRSRLGSPTADRPRGNGGRMDVTATIEIEGMAGGFSEPAGPVGLAFSPDGRALAARGPNRSVRIWDVTTGKEIDQLPGHLARIETVAFAPDGKMLASGAPDTTILLWDTADPLKKVAQTQTVEVPHPEMDTLWDDLAGNDGARAFQAVLRLSAAPQQAVSFLGERLKPTERIDPRKIDGWMGELESDKYAVRKAAADSLLRAGEQTVPALRKVLAASPPLETRKRIEELLEKLTSGQLSTRQLQMVRAVEVLERIGTPQARQVLQALGQGAPGTLPTREAEAALSRLAGSAAARP